MCASHDKEDLNPPKYDGIEPYYIFKRRWDAYIAQKTYKDLYDNILDFFNILFELDNKNLLAFKDIKEEDLPTSSTVSDLITANEQYKVFRIRHNSNIPTCKMLHSILNKINFSFVLTETKKGNFYSIKHQKTY